jgi:glyoxylase-like metal-dependent hydrolase (beta-lactamase superfamily II)
LESDTMHSAIKPIVGSAIVLTTVVLLGVGSRAQNQGLPSTDVEILPVQGNVYLIARAGANITVQTGKDGVLLVDAGAAQMSGKVLDAIQKITSLRGGSRTEGRLEGKIRFIINTNSDADHTGANEPLSKAGLGYVTNDPANRLSGLGNDPAMLVAHENVVARLLAPPGGGTPAPVAALPQNIYTGAGESRKDLFFDDDGIQVMHAPSAHTDGDSLVYFRKNDVVSAGDVYVTTGYPVIDLQKGGSLQGVIAGLNRLLDIAIPGHSEEDGTIIVPGHGRLSDEADVAEYRDTITILRDRIEASIRNGATLEQVKTARLTRDYDPQYGAGGPGGANTERFVEAAYRSLTQKK